MMSQYPGFPPPSDPSLGYMSSGPAPARPTVVTVMSIIAMVFGGLGTFCSVIGSVFALFGVAMRNAMKANPAFNGATVATSPALTAYQAIVTIIWLILSLILLMVGIGGMSLKPWARRAAMTWSIATIIIATIELVIGIAWVNPATSAAIRKSAPGNPFMSSFGTGFYTIGAIVGWLLTCILPVIFLILWRRNDVKVAFGELPATGTM